MAVELSRCSVHPDRTRFLTPSDHYDCWVILSAYAGSFRFSIQLADSPGASDTAAAGLVLSGDCGPGDLVLCPPLAILQREMTTMPTSFFFAEFAPGPEPLPGKTTIRDLHRLQSTYDYLVEVHSASPGQARWDAMTHLVTDLLFLLSVERASAERPSDPLMREVAGFLDQHAYSADLSLSGLAHRLGLSPSRLTRRFRASYGMTPMAYVTATRLARARQLLMETDLILSLVATQCGYQNSFYFSRVFRQKVGMNPSSYRRAYRI